LDWSDSFVDDDGIYLIQLKGTTSAGTVNCYSSLRIFRIA